MMKFQQFLEASQKAKGKIGEGATPSFKELVEDELKKLSSLENTNIDPDFEITEDEFNSIMEEVYKTPRFKEAPHLYEDDLNEAATFDLKTFLIQTANYMKAEAGIEDAVKKLYDAKIAGVKKETEFEDKWPETMKKMEDKVKQEWKAKIDAAQDPKKKSGMRQQRDAALEGLEEKMKEVKTAKLKIFKQSTVDKENAATEKIKKLESPASGMPPYAGTIISGLKTSATNDGELALAEEKYADNEEKLKKVKQRLDKKEKENAQELEQDMAAAEQKMNAAQTKAGDQIRGEQPQDAGISEKDKSAFEDGKEQFAQAHEEMAATKTAFGAVKAESQAYLKAVDEYDNAPDDQKDAKAEARDNAKANYDKAKSDYTEAKSTAESAIKRAISWCKKNETSQQSDLKTLAGSKGAFEAMNDAIGSFEIVEPAAK